MITNICTGTQEVLVLEKEARDAAASGNYERAVSAATDAKLAIDSDVLSNINMMVSRLIFFSYEDNILRIFSFLAPTSSGCCEAKIGLILT